MINLFRYYGFPFENIFGLITTPLILLLFNNFWINLKICFLNFIVVQILKFTLPNNDRPCKNKKEFIDGNWFQQKILNCSFNNDVPSGHSTVSAFFGLLFITHDKLIYKICSIYFFSLGVSRYYANQHTIFAIIFGYILGTIFFVLSRQLIKDESQVWQDKN